MCPAIFDGWAHFMEKQMEERDQLVNLLLTNFGVDLYPKPDGRIEIPKYIISVAGWDSSSMVYMSSDLSGNIYISTDSSLVEDEISIAVAISHGRLRIPAGFLKKARLFNRSLVSVYDMNSMLHLRPDNSDSIEALSEFLSTLDDNQVNELSNILTGRVQSNIRQLPHMEIIRVPVNQKELPEAKLFLLEGNEQHSFIFRPVGNPYKFKCCWVNKTPMLAHGNDDNNCLATIYAIPGVKRVKKDAGVGIPGFLLIDQMTFGKICYVVKKKGENTAVDRDLIFMFSPKTKVGSFKVFENPKEDLDTKIIEEAKQVCANPEKFLSTHFNLFDRGKCDLPPNTITINTMGKMINKESK